MMHISAHGRWLVTLLAGALLFALSGAATRGTAADFGRLTGTVIDTEGNPLMGATVLLAGQALSAPETLGGMIERVTTDAHGRFTVEHLSPGWYSLRVISATRMPAMRDRIRVAAGETTEQKFVLGDIFSPLHMQKTEPDFSTWGGDWKWILRTSESTRPVLRYRKTEQASNTPPKLPLPASEHMIGMMPGSLHQDSMSEDPGMGSVLAYLRPLGQDSDLLVAGSLAATGLQASAFVTAVRRNLAKGDPQELSLVVHNLNFDEGGMPLVAVGEHGNLTSAQGMVISYAHTRRLYKTLTLTTGFEADYLNASRDAQVLRPRLEVDYQVSPATTAIFSFGAPRTDGMGTILDRVGLLNQFPRVSLSGFRPKLEDARHTELGVQHRIGKASRVEIAAYTDSFRNAAVWGFGEPRDWAGLAGDLLPNAAQSGVVLNVGSYEGKGFRADYERQFGAYSEVAVVYLYGDALAPVNGMQPFPQDGVVSAAQIASHLRPRSTESVSSRVSTRIPICHTQIVTSYTWLPQGRVTVVDPYGLARMDAGPFLGVQIRQPLPTVAFLPAHIEALADFRNLLGQGAVPVVESGGKPVTLTSAYRTLRGGFSVQF